MTTRRVPITDLLVDPANARRRSKNATAKLNASLGAFGPARSIVIDGEGTVRAGNGTLEAARAAGVEEAIVVEADGTQLVVVERADWSAAEARAYGLADNQLGTLASWDDTNLDALLADLDANHKDLLELTGFDPGEILKRLGNPDGDAADGAGVEPASEPVTKPGELWLLGEHRLVCGDSTDQNDVALARGDLDPFMMVTDPPYGVAYKPEWRDATDVRHTKNRAKGKVTNDDRADWSEAWAHFAGPCAYIWHASTHGHEMQPGLVAQGFRVRCIIVWAKQHFTLGGMQQLYHQRHELCLVLQRGPLKWVGGRKQQTVWDDIQAPNGFLRSDEKRHGGHGTQKPIECMARPIRNHGAEGDVVYDPFLGSGTTLIAADINQRVCCGLEIDPGYCDAIVQRWEEHTGGSATRGGSV